MIDGRKPIRLHAGMDRMKQKIRKLRQYHYRKENVPAAPLSECATRKANKPDRRKDRGHRTEQDQVAYDEF